MAARKLIVGSWDREPPAEKVSLGIPTWFYGHEPPNFFASHHSKMFFNSLREDGLVTLANKGIIFFEGNGGTVREIFQDAAQNYYVGEGHSPTPMIFYNAGGYWERRFRVCLGRQMRQWIRVNLLCRSSSSLRLRRSS